MLLGPLLAGLAAIGATGLATAHLRRVRSAPSAGAPAIMAALRRAPQGERASLARTMASSASWEAALAAGIVDARSGEEAALAVDEALREADARLRGARGWSPAASRVALLGGLLGAAVSGIGGDLVAAMLAAALGAAGAGGAAALGRRASAEEKAQRRRADDLVALLIGGRAGGEPATRPVLDRPRRAR